MVVLSNGAIGQQQALNDLKKYFGVRKMVKYVDVEESEANHVLIFGEPGTGKSTLASLLALNFKLLWISCDNGHKRILSKLPREAKERIELIVLPDTPDFPVAISSLLRITSGAAVELCDSHGQKDCGTCRKNAGAFTRVCLNELGLDTIVVIDNLSRVSDSAVNFIIKRESKSKDEMEGYKLDYGDWANANMLIGKICNNIEQARWNCVAIAHTVESELEEGGKRIVPKLTTRDFSIRAAGFFDHVVYCQVKNKSHKFGSSTTYDMSATTKSRSDVAIEKLEVPSLLPFFDGTIPAPKTASDKPTASKVLTTVTKPTVSLGLSTALAELKGRG
jgi:DNA polymerase III delta prime subunit